MKLLGILVEFTSSRSNLVKLLFKILAVGKLCSDFASLLELIEHMALPYFV